MTVSIIDQLPPPEANHPSTVRIDEKSIDPSLTPTIEAGSSGRLSWIQRWQYISPYFLTAAQSFLIQFCSGLNDGNLGIILPSIKAHYGLSQYVVSIIFLSNALGYITAAVLNGYLIKYFSQSKTALIGGCSMIIGYLVILFAVPFPVTCIFMMPIGFGIALTQAAANVVCGEMPYGMLMLSFLHAFYAGGALIGPLLASGILSSQKPWNTTYMVLCGLAGANVISIFICFRKLRTDSEKELDAEKERMLQHSDSDHHPQGQEHNEATNGSITTAFNDQQIDQESLTSKEYAQKNNSLLSQIFKFRLTTVGSVFLCFYTGLEVTIGNWGYTYLISTRSTDTVAMAHLMTGYWSGICAGRLFLGFATSRFGEKRMVYCYLSMIVVMLILLWFLPYIGANAASLAITGCLLGPIFPTMIAVAQRIVPTHLYATSVGFLSAFASAGTAIFPYVGGILIGSKGISSMLPFCVALGGAMLVMWIFIPDPRPPTKLSAKFKKWMTDLGPWKST
ncbi:major facilitator superfamily domain-containing protein [Phascolomyces articulosus]|uniref:Major facilitator superfamily domain-containing protein n=1 Tax=Phascolomyces articulosus TaxID=60185 RepID=A0AAD5PGV5_9FUNG|nr:major facilitator superfamily domain-containing protein [Phascolomyces articulosus]